MAMLATMAFSASAAMTLKDLNPGKTVVGPDLKVEEMKGKVVLVMYWGTK
jgi:hypothetical protein